MNIVTRKVALAQKLTRYFTGKPCKNGHIAERKTKNGTCIECHKKHYGDPVKNLYLKHKNKAKERGIPWLFTFETWLEFWGEKLEYRNGHSVDGLVCGRYFDCGPYSPDNCYITTRQINLDEARTGQYQYKPYSQTDF